MSTQPLPRMTAAAMTAQRTEVLVTELARQRDRYGLSLREVTFACGISSPSMFFEWEQGKRHPRPGYRRVLAAFYAMPETQLFQSLTPSYLIAPPKPKRLEAWAI